MLQSNPNYTIQHLINNIQIKRNIASYVSHANNPNKRLVTSHIIYGNISNNRIKHFINVVQIIQTHYEKDYIYYTNNPNNIKHFMNSVKQSK